MRYIPIATLLAQIFADEDGESAKARLTRAHKRVAKMEPDERKSYIDRVGSRKWTPVKNRLIELLGRKCWYTEVELIGAPLAIDHFRPVCFYWWLAYDAENYRVSCAWANSPEHNAAHGCAGGKGENFPLRPPELRARGKSHLRVEKPVILDPCNAADCELLAFQVDGRPVISPQFATNATAVKRVERSKILLNLDHPEFNSKREQLCQDIADAVATHESLPPDSNQQFTIRARLAERIASNAPFSTAARFYLRLHRHLDWVESILDAG